MTNNDKELLKSLLKQMNGFELEEIRKEVDSEIETQYFKDENFWMRSTTDDYIYINIYSDGSYHYDYIGARAYKNYIKDNNCVQIDYKTKDLFPKFGTLARKECYAR